MTFFPLLNLLRRLMEAKKAMGPLSSGLGQINIAFPWVNLITASDQAANVLLS